MAGQFFADRPFNRSLWLLDPKDAPQTVSQRFWAGHDESHQDDQADQNESRNGMFTKNHFFTTSLYKNFPMKENRLACEYCTLTPEAVLYQNFLLLKIILDIPVFFI